MTVRFSIITPARNQERYLEQALCSVLTQEHRDWELLVVDDASTDGTGAIAEAFARQDPRIRVLRHADGAHRGAAASRNLAIREATGEYVAFLDADDMFLPNRLAAHARVIAGHPGLAGIYGMARWQFESTGRTVTENLGPVADTLAQPADFIDSIIVNHKGAVPCPSVMSMRRDLALASGGFEEDFDLYEDQTLWVKVFSRHPVYASAQEVAIYRQHPQSTSSQALRDGRYAEGAPSPATRRFLAWMADQLARKAQFDAASRTIALQLRLYDPRISHRLVASARLHAQRVLHRLRAFTRPTGRSRTRLRQDSEAYKED